MHAEKRLTETITGAGSQDVLARHGYKQELKREMGWFSSFAMSFSIIAVTTGLFATYGAGLATAGPAFIWTWPVVGVGQLLLALVLPNWLVAYPYPGWPISGLENSAERRWGGGRVGS